MILLLQGMVHKVEVAATLCRTMEAGALLQVLPLHLDHISARVCQKYLVFLLVDRSAVVGTVQVVSVTLLLGTA